MDRATLVRQWDEAWRDGLWAAPWSRALDDLSPDQFIWRPQAQRHCIWQYVDHMLFWRDVALRRTRGEQVAPDEQQRRNFVVPPEPSPSMAEELRRRWRQSHEQVRCAMADESAALDRLQYLAFHDSYHVGQIMLLRGMLGLPPIE